MARCVVFLGPSLSHKEARELLGEGCELLPPVKRGDLPALPNETRLVAIVDGVFLGESAVGHREIVEKLRMGVEVVGGGSMGALRASELHSFGMKGIGEVYRLYASQEIEGDDEVALIFNPEDFEALSEPLVNMRHNLNRYAARGMISESQRMEILERLKALYYPKRTKQTMLEIAGQVLDDASLSEFEIVMRKNYVDIKREDALAVIRYLIKSLEKTAKNSEKRVDYKRP